MSLESEAWRKGDEEAKEKWNVKAEFTESRATAPPSQLKNMHSKSKSIPCFAGNENVTSQTSTCFITKLIRFGLGY